MSNPGNSSSDSSGNGNGGTLTGMAAVEQVFHFLDGPADVLSAATACRRWRELACADSVWRAKFRREKLLEKARLFEVALPPVPGGQGGAASAAAAAAAAATAVVKDEAAGVGLAFYARIFALKGYQMRDEDIDEYEDNPDHDGGIRTAVRVWFADPTAAKARYGPIASWDTSGIADMNRLFIDQEDFNEDISRWNVSNVVNMDYTFAGAASFNGDLSQWEVGQVESMGGMFGDATSFTGDLSSWEVGQVKSMDWMFYGATSYNGDLSSWAVGQVESMSMMFDDATSFIHQLGGAWSTSTATKLMMFCNSPGTVTGKVKDADGTIA